ncbi:KpsF/GutQ family sugar-phosphate isomerase [Georgenia satyanarayanai]|uniref:KpsF/GutQ family sugar-phosphate isomerase n=1 Tax=Georgenia satyanarayanai TaxID=860221 RepID=UPI00126449DF|nr:SIS domain-containing protein [Georgenia satyanarayanai]
MKDRHELLQAAARFIEQEGAAVARVAAQVDESLLAVADLIREAGGKVIVTGSGTSGTIARRLAHLLSVTGTPALYQNPGDGLHGSLGVATAGDVVIAISKGGESTELAEFIRRTKDRGAKGVVLTAAPESSLAQAADAVVVIDSDSADPGGIIAMGSTLATAAWGDALAILLMGEGGYTWEKVLHSHPGGAVGRNAEELLKAVEG